jgi:hypothetical protein
MASPPGTLTVRIGVEPAGGVQVVQLVSRAIKSTPFFISIIIYMLKVALRYRLVDRLLKNVIAKA